MTTAPTPSIDPGVAAQACDAARPLWRRAAVQAAFDALRPKPAWRSGKLTVEPIWTPSCTAWRWAARTVSVPTVCRSSFEAAAPADEQLEAILPTINTRLMKLLTRRRVLVEVQGKAYMADMRPTATERARCGRCGRRP